MKSEMKGTAQKTIPIANTEMNTTTTFTIAVTIRRTRIATTWLRPEGRSKFLTNSLITSTIGLGLARLLSVELVSRRYVDPSTTARAQRNQSRQTKEATSAESIDCRRLESMTLREELAQRYSTVSGAQQTSGHTTPKSTRSSSFNRRLNATKTTTLATTKVCTGWPREPTRDK